LAAASNEGQGNTLAFVVFGLRCNGPSFSIDPPPEQRPELVE